MSMTKTKPKVKNITEANALMGELAPHNIEAEKALLGLLLVENSTIDIATSIIGSPEYFYKTAHQEIYRCIVNLRDRNGAVDTITLFEYIQTEGKLTMIGGPVYFMQITNTVVSNTDVYKYSQIITEKYMRRKLAEISRQITANSYLAETDIFDLLDFAETEIMGINKQTSGGYKKIDESVASVMMRLNDLRNSDKELTGVKSGFKPLDRLTCGWQPTDLIILAARPSVGKTAFALNLARNAATGADRVNVAFFSLEMSTEQLVHRVLSIESQILLEKISRGRLDDDEFNELTNKGANVLLKMGMYIDDTPALSIYEMRSKCRKMKQAHNIGLIIIDYLQLMSGANGSGSDKNREQEISKISRDLKSLAKDLKVPIIALSQLSRETEKRQVKVPILSDLRESGAIEQDADIVMFMYRPEYYSIKADENGDKLNGDTDIKFAKHRNGPLDTIKIRARLATQTFEDMEETPVQLGWQPFKTSVFSNNPPPIKKGEDEPDYKF